MGPALPHVLSLALAPDQDYYSGYSRLCFILALEVVHGQSTPLLEKGGPFFLAFSGGAAADAGGGEMIDLVPWFQEQHGLGIVADFLDKHQRPLVQHPGQE